MKQKTGGRVLEAVQTIYLKPSTACYSQSRVVLKRVSDLRQLMISTNALILLDFSDESNCVSIQSHHQNNETGTADLTLLA